MADENELTQPQHPIQKLIDVMAQLRNPEGGCPWDIQQTHSSIANYTIEEAYELADALVNGTAEQIKEELGDLLFQVVFHAQISSEKNGFNFEDITECVATKMVERHPHVFQPGHENTLDSATAQWEELKAKERSNLAHRHGKQISALDGVALALPSLVRAQKIQKRASQYGFDWPDLPPVISKIREELHELEIEINVAAANDRLADELGDLLFACVNLARHIDVNPETALHKATQKFDRRFRYIEDKLRAADKSLKAADLEEMESLWSEAKLQE